MSKRLVLRIERDGRLLGSWSLGPAPLEMTMVDVATGKTVARFSASAEALSFVDTVQQPAPPPRGSVDELPVPVVRLDGDDFTMPLPEPTDQAIGDLVTEERPRPQRSRPLNLAELPVAPADSKADSQAGDGLTAELVESEAGDGLTAELQDDDVDPLDLPSVSYALEEIGEDLVDERSGLTRDLVLVDDPDIEPGRPGASLDELPVPQGPHSQPGLTAELRTATVDLPQRRERQAFGREDEPSLTAKAPLRSATDPEQTPRALISRPARPHLPPQPAEVWAQKRGEWSSLGHLTPGQRVSTLGGWVRLAPDGRLVVHSGRQLAGTATLVDGRMIEIENGEDFLALPPGSSVMLAMGDRGIYVRSEPLPEEQQPELRAH